jgi:hypothetical protein
VVLERGPETIALLCLLSACGSRPNRYPWPSSSSDETQKNPRVAEAASEAGTNGFAGPGDDEQFATGPDGGRIPFGRPCMGFTFCGPDFGTRIRFTGDLAALRSSSLAVCRNRQCSSSTLGPFIDAFFAPHPGNKLVLTFEARTEDAGPRPKITFSIASDAVTQDGCKPWCDAEIGFTRAQGDVDRDGDVYEVTIGRPSGASRGAIRNTARYKAWTIEDNCFPETCHGFGTDHTKERPMSVR